MFRVVCRVEVMAKHGGQRPLVLVRASVTSRPVFHVPMQMCQPIMIDPKDFFSKSRPILTRATGKDTAAW